MTANDWAAVAFVALYGLGCVALGLWLRRQERDQ